MSTTTTVTATDLTPIVTDYERVYNLTRDLALTKQQKKDAADGFRDEIKRIEGEIKDILKGAGEDLGDGNDIS